jgi:hypothetical protein
MIKGGRKFSQSDGRWAILWQSSNILDGDRCHFVRDVTNCNIMIFRTRHEARKEIWTRFGYIKDRSDLKSEPHGWKVPKPVRVRLTAELEH